VLLRADLGLEVLGAGLLLYLLRLPLIRPTSSMSPAAFTT